MIGVKFELRFFRINSIPRSALFFNHPNMVQDFSSQEYEKAGSLHLLTL